jgi:hypothetical protein
MLIGAAVGALATHYYKEYQVKREAEAMASVPGKHGSSAKKSSSSTAASSGKDKTSARTSAKKTGTKAKPAT